MFGIRRQLFLITLASVLSSATVLAQDNAATTGTTAPSASENYLKEIRDTLLININKLPVYLNQLTKMALSWLAPDDSTNTANLQNSFTVLLNANLQNRTTQLNSQHNLLAYFLGNPQSQEEFQNANDISYSTLVNQPYFNPDIRKDVDSAYNYTLYAAGLNMRHLKPGRNWETNPRKNPATSMYINYYNTASAVQTYDAYVLSALYADAKNSGLSKKTQDSLIQQASSSTWFTQVASENLGIVLRQILLFNSQSYVLLAQLLETEKKLLAAQAMNNSLLLAVNLEAENRIYSNASGTPPV